MNNQHKPRYIPKRIGDYYYVWDTRDKCKMTTDPFINRKTAAKYAAIDNANNTQKK